MTFQQVFGFTKEELKERGYTRWSMDIASRMGKEEILAWAKRRRDIVTVTRRDAGWVERTIRHSDVTGVWDETVKEHPVHIIVTWIKGRS